MSKFSGWALLAGAFSVIVIVGARFILTFWHPALYGFLAVFIASLVVSAVFDYKLYLEILSLKTAKKGLSLGWGLTAVLIFLGALSYLGNRFDRSFDLTDEKINSLAEQSLSALEGLDSELVFYVFYKGGQLTEPVRAVKAELKSNIQLYKQSSSRIRLVFKDVYKDNLKAEEYLSDLPDKQNQQLFVFVNYKGRKVRVSAPFEEEDLTSAMIKAKKREFKEIVFLTGHGEKDLDSPDPSGLKILRRALVDSGFVFVEWHFAEQGRPPENPPAVVMIAGPIRPLAPLEEAWLKSYLQKGGSLFLALDPGERHGMGDFLSDFGLRFNNDFILTSMPGFVVSSTVLGVQFDGLHPAVGKLAERRMPVFFDRASSWDILSDERFEGFSFSKILKSDSNSFSVPRLEKKSIQKAIRKGESLSLTMAVEARGKLKAKNGTAVMPLSEKDPGKKGPAVEESGSLDEAGQEEKASSEEKSKDGEFRLVAFGDSDFLSNKAMYEGANKDLALNTLVWLAGEEELVSIRPKRAKGTKIQLGRNQKILLLFFYIAFPCLFLFASLWIWLKRRSM